MAAAFTTNEHKIGGQKDSAACYNYVRIFKRKDKHTTQ